VRILKNNKKLFPKNFFTKERKEMSSKEALKDVIPPAFNKINKKKK